MGGLWPDLRTLGAMAWFALPFVPGGLGFFLLHSGDRFFLMKYADAAALGLYALGYKLAFSVSQFSRSPLYMVWNTQMHQAAFREDAPDVFGRAFTRILGAYLAVGLALCLLADEAAFVLGGAPYAGGHQIIPIVVLAYYCLTAADLMDSGFYVSRRTVWKTPITLASTVVMLVLYCGAHPPATPPVGAQWRRWVASSSTPWSPGALRSGSSRCTTSGAALAPPWDWRSVPGWCRGWMPAGTLGDCRSRRLCGRRGR